ncbi:hypothetical protein GGTG_04853 [Gaeumannomyces tritici R3-111a-1]|uniref:Uncharacterized protein n=1 Tax=Gaeumannomyces tritici (strain R3-111a-1) TaxID=644352 RepID=J3NU99_GAET3|nr:hypothetical protein GGTG_04853 [Gaeumannomyces tritici R3-111a-1]EJT79770.1 hypothetical protein GGTG_04853 [Gaeumannomyces tritici R3-111a-1]
MALLLCYRALNYSCSAQTICVTLLLFLYNKYKAYLISLFIIINMLLYQMLISSFFNLESLTIKFIITFCYILLSASSG